MDKKFVAPQRVIEKEIVDQESGILIQIQKTLGFRPRYQFALGRKLPAVAGIDGSSGRPERFVPYLPVMVKTHQGQVVSQTTFAGVVARLFAEADYYVHDMCQSRENEIFEEQLAREQKELNRNKPKQQPGLKSLAKRDKQLRAYAAGGPCPASGGTGSPANPAFRGTGGGRAGSSASGGNEEALSLARPAEGGELAPPQVASSAQDKS